MGPRHVYLAPKLVLPERAGQSAVGLQQSSGRGLHGLARGVTVPQAARRSHVLPEAHPP